LNKTFKNSALRIELLKLKLLKNKSWLKLLPAIGLYIDCGCLFWVSFWACKKVQNINFIEITWN